MIGRSLVRGLVDAAYRVNWHTDLRRACSELLDRESPFTVALIDVGPRVAPGLGAIRELRRLGVRIPVMLMATLDGTDERNRGLDAGADDYLVKPFTLPDLLVRLSCLMRQPDRRYDEVLRVGHLALDAGRRQLQHRERVVDLDPRETAVLHALMLCPGAVLSKRQLEERVCGSLRSRESALIEGVVRRLQQKIGFDWVENLGAAGWRLDWTTRPAPPAMVQERE